MHIFWILNNLTIVREKENIHKAHFLSLKKVCDDYDNYVKRKDEKAETVTRIVFYTALRKVFLDLETKEFKSASFEKK